MAWWDEVADFVGSVAGAVGDGVEAVVNVVTEGAEEVVESTADVANAFLDGLRDGAAAVGPALGWIANVGLGVLKGGLEALADLAGIGIDIARGIGRLVSDILHFDLAGTLDDLGNIGIGVGLLIPWALRTASGGYFGGGVIDYFERDRALAFIRTLIIDEFGDREGEDILRRLGWGTAHFGLPINASVRLMCADSADGANSFPFAALHPNPDLFALAGLLSFNSFQLGRGRTRVVQVDSSGNDMWWWPMTRSAIRGFLDSGGTSIRVRAYALTPQAAGEAMRTAYRKFKKLGIDITWSPSFNFPSFQSFVTQPCRNVREFSFFAGSVTDPGDAVWFAGNTPRNASPEQDGTPLAIAVFGYEDGKSGLVTGRIINRGRLPGCDGQSTADECVTVIPRQAGDYDSLDTDFDGIDDVAPDAAVGCGVSWRDPYPPCFAQYVLAHELGHYFGLAHPGHDGFDKIMIATRDGSSVWGGDTWWRYWFNGEAEFIQDDVEQAWRFIVKEMPHVLRAL